MSNLTLRLVYIRGEYAFAVCVNGVALLAFSTYKQAAIEMRDLNELER